LLRRPPLSTLIPYTTLFRSHGAADPAALLVELLPGLPARLQHPVGDHLHGGGEVEVLPLGAVGAPVADGRLAQLAGDEVLARRALGAEPAPVDRRVGVALDLHDLLVLDEDLLRAADRAVGADALGDPVGGAGARLDLVGALGAGGLASPEDVGAGELSQHRPRQQRTLAHRPPP